MKISKNCLDIIEKWEGLKLEAYIDPVGIPTIGYGTIRYPNGQKVKLGDKIAQAEAEAFLKFEVDEVVKNLTAVLAGINLNQNQFDAIVSLCYNIGVGAFKDSTVLRKLKEGDFQAASVAFGLWNKGTIDGVKKELAGLTNRRKEERELFEKTGEQGNPIVVEESLQDKVTLLEGYRVGDDNIIVAWAGDSAVEILVLKSSVKEDLIRLLQQYKNAKSFQIAPSGKSLPNGKKTEVTGKSADIPKASNAPELQRSVLILGVRDDDPNSSGSDVRELQQRLQELRYYKGEIDGKFGKATDAAVRDFQTDCFGIAEADGKVGRKTWDQLWGVNQPPVPATPPDVAAPVPGKHYLLLTKTSQKDIKGFFKLKLEYFKDGQSKDFIQVISGLPNRQFFRKGKDSIPLSYEPLPEGKWAIHNIEFKAGKDVYDDKIWSGAIGPAKIRLDYVPPNGTRRSAIEIHLDWNKTNSPGTAGCIGLNSISDFKKLVGWLRETDPRDLYVDWGLGSVEIQ